MCKAPNRCRVYGNCYEASGLLINYILLPKKPSYGNVGASLTTKVEAAWFHCVWLWKMVNGICMRDGCQFCAFAGTFPQP